MRFIEETETAWSAEQLAAAEREIEEQKREWEENRLAAMREEEKRRAREMEEEADMLTFSREDATNQVSKTKKVIKRRNSKIIKRVKVVKKNASDVKIKSKRIIVSGSDTSVGVTLNKRKGKGKRRVAKRKEIVEADSTTQSSISDAEAFKVNGDDSNSKWSCDGEINTNTESDADSDLVPLAKKRDIASNHIDHNSPRTRSHGTVAINLWTLDVSPILPGVKPIVKNSANLSVTKRELSRNSSSEKEVDVESVDKAKKNNSSLDEKKKSVIRRKRGRRKKPESNDDTSNIIETNSNDSVASTENENVEEDIEKALNACKEKVCKVVIQDVMTTGDANKYLPKNNNKNVDLTDNLDQETEIEIAKTDNGNKTTSTPKSCDTNKKRKNLKNCNNTLDSWLLKARDKDDVISGNSILRTSNTEPNED